MLLKLEPSSKWLLNAVKIGESLHICPPMLQQSAQSATDLLRDRPIHIHTDWSETAMGAPLSQMNEAGEDLREDCSHGGLRPVSV